MSIKYTAIITKDEDWWLGWIEEIPGANAQERTNDC
jgi:predicted RNase H-like HicB family nuclease